MLLTAASLAAQPCQKTFWCDLPYGSESQFNPLTAIANDGFDILQMEGRGNRLDSLFRIQDVNHLFSTIAHPIVAVDRAGWGNFLGTEVVPTSFNSSDAAWIPNYQLHLIGGGMVNARAEEWFVAHGVSSPFLPALMTSYTGYLLNETMEIRGVSSEYPTDPLADLYIFDAAGIAIFHIEAVRTFFQSTVQLLNWPLQPSVGLIHGTLENPGEYFALKVPLPWESKWRLFYEVGLGNLGGLSRDLPGGNAISFAAGAYASRINPVNQTTNKVEMAPKVGLFWDKNNSLMASCFWNGQSDQRFSAQLYPGVLPTGPVPLGGWLSLTKDFEPTIGLTLVWGFGASASLAS